MTIKNSFKQLPNEKGYFGDFGGRYVSETLMPLIEEVEQEYNSVRNDSKFQKEFDYYLKNYVVFSIFYKNFFKLNLNTRCIFIVS